ncbi:thioredoxin reductase 1, cytoplasmic-like [Halichondria panicea]|uniref:thioredoxin reductase 1, cytoplasmic-like n=1 Tax=Halichondria panicea TaxID=6063 RepID=UPI00312B93B9
MADLKATIEEQIKNSHVLIYSKSTCPFCIRVKKLFSVQYVSFTAVELDTLDNASQYQDNLEQISGQRTVPNVFINGKHIGGCDAVVRLYSTGELAKLLVKGTQEKDPFNKDHTYDYDLIVIGGGSGGLACSKEAASQGARVACLDYVKPTPLDTQWGLGGTCVNVGCVPKKLMHQAALLGHAIEDAKQYGWEVSGDVGHKWSTLVEAVQAHIGSLNWGYRVALRDKNVKYINGLGSFQDAHTIKHINKRGKEAVITAARIVVAVGGRPRYPDIPGAREYCITSDDLFSMPTSPGKTLVIGASYVALECAGFLAGIGFDVTCMVRSILLRGFDQQMAEMAGEWMAEHKVKFQRKCVPTKVELIEKGGDGKPQRLRVEYKNNETGQVSSEEFNTVMLAVGRDPDTKLLGLDKAGVELSKSGHISAVYEQTKVPHIYAIGDVLQSKQELTPVAIQAGKLLAKRLFGGGSSYTDHVNVATTVFTPLEFGTIGLAEEDAETIFGKQNIEVYHSYFTPLEFTVAKRGDNSCYGKLICNKADNERVVGFHVLSPNSGEITQGYDIAIRMGATKDDFDATIGIHPTCSENFTTLYVTKSSGADVKTAGC